MILSQAIAGLAIIVFMLIIMVLADAIKSAGESIARGIQQASLTNHQDNNAWLAKCDREEELQEQIDSAKTGIRKLKLENLTG